MPTVVSRGQQRGTWFAAVTSIGNDLLECLLCACDASNEAQAQGALEMMMAKSSTQHSKKTKAHR